MIENGFGKKGNGSIGTAVYCPLGVDEQNGGCPQMLASWILIGRAKPSSVSHFHWVLAVKSIS